MKRKVKKKQEEEENKKIKIRCFYCYSLQTFDKPKQDILALLDCCCSFCGNKIEYPVTDIPTFIRKILSFEIGVEIKELIFKL